LKKHRLWLLFVLLALAVAGTLASRAQDTRTLRPPKGAKVAIVVFEDLQCPDCSRAHPLLAEAARTYKIPLVRYDYPLPQHDWSKEAAVIARYFENNSKKLGDDFRDAVFSHQQEITKQNLRPFAEKFAAEHKVELPIFVDPQGKLAGQVQADYELGQRVGVQHTPTIYIVSNSQQGSPFVEVVDRSQLYQMIDQMKHQAE
jgi:protein-disulfide isomerase